MFSNDCIEAAYIRAANVDLSNCRKFNLCTVLQNYNNIIFLIKNCVCCTMYAGVRDRSGFNLTYLSTGRKHDAGVLEVGHTVLPTMIVPGRAVSYSIFGVCNSSCTSVCLVLACS